MTLTRLDLAAVVRDSLSLLRASIPAGVDIASEIAPELPWVNADATQVHQVLMNLVTNAWHALRGVEGREPRIAVRLGQVTLDAARAGALGAERGPGDYLCLAVEDNGVGIAGHALARVFEPFFTTRETGEGTGLGLSVVHGIVTAHRGAIEVASTPGVGTVFRLYLPAAGAASAAAIAPAPRPRDPSHGAPVRMLYIDDEAAMATLVSELLGEAGFKVTTCTDPRAALALLRARAQDFDVVVTDYNMPGLSGLEVAHTLTAQHPALPVVVSSGYVTAELQQAAAAGAVAALVNKVDTTEALAPTVREVLAARAATPART